jgi:hypothetical protein
MLASMCLPCRKQFVHIGFINVSYKHNASEVLSGLLNDTFAAIYENTYTRLFYSL